LAADKGLEKNKKEASMAFVKKPPENVSRNLQLEKPVSEWLDEYCTFVDCTPDYVANFALRQMLTRDPEYKKWKAVQEEPNGKKTQTVAGKRA
jgi:hypothetical protein